MNLEEEATRPTSETIRSRGDENRVVVSRDANVVIAAERGSGMQRIVLKSTNIPRHSMP